jgi:hypothetical protein
MNRFEMRFQVAGFLGLQRHWRLPVRLFGMATVGAGMGSALGAIAMPLHAAFKETAQRKAEAKRKSHE